MYDIGNVILGTHLPWDKQSFNDVAAAYVATDPTVFELEGMSLDDLMASAEQGELEWLEVYGDGRPWNVEYHGGGDSYVAWVGVRLGKFDVTNHFPLSKITEMAAKAELGSDLYLKALLDWEDLPPAVRKLLPPFGVYVVWSSS